MKNRYWLILLLLCFSTAISFYIFKRKNFYKNLANHLDFFCVVDDEPECVDVIFTFSGDEPIREREALRLLQRHKNAIWIMSFSKPCSYLEKTLQQKLDTSRIFQVKNLKNTFEEILNLRLFLEDNRKNTILLPNIKETSIALVSTKWHTKRIQMISNTLLKGYNFSLISVEDNKTNGQNRRFCRDEYHDMFFDWWRCFIWVFSFRTIAVMANRKTVEKCIY